MIHSLARGIASLFLGIAALFSPSVATPQVETPAVTPAEAVAFGSISPVGTTQFTLAGAGITSTQNTIQLSSFTTPDGRALTMAMFGAVGYGALEPQTTARLEDVTFTGITQNANGTATLTGVTRGNDFVSPYAASTTLAHSHAGGSTFIITNTAGFYGGQFALKNNDETITGQWTFSTFPITPANATSSETVAGISQLSTAAQAAAGTSLGSTGGRLVLPASLATSTYNAATAPNRVIVTKANGTIDTSFLGTTTVALATTTISGSLTLSGGAATSNIASSTVYATTTTGVWTKPANLRYVIVEAIGGGGNGGQDSATVSGAGGGSGGYCKKLILASSLSATVTITVGTAAASTTFGSFLNAGPGTSGSADTPGTGGVCVSGDVSISGQSGSVPMPQIAPFGTSGAGASSMFGQGGMPNVNNSAGATAPGKNASGYGAGGSGSLPATDGSPSGGSVGAGSPGYVVITSFFF